MEKQLIFISCGQLTEAEKFTGVLLKTIVDGTSGFEAYFAETVQDLDALAQHVFEGIQNCSGAIVVLHKRGLVTNSDDVEYGNRSSVWINQEIAILAYRQYFESKRLPLLAFMDTGVKLEGAMTSLIANPTPLPPRSRLADDVRAWLEEAEFAGSSAEIFLAKWEELTESARGVVAVLCDEGGESVKEHIVYRWLIERFDLDSKTADNQLRAAKQQFMSTGLVQLVQNNHSGDELTLHPEWKHQLRRMARTEAVDSGNRV